MRLDASEILKRPVDFVGVDTPRPIQFEGSNLLIQTIKYVVQRIIMILLYPAQSKFFQYLHPFFYTSFVDARRRETLKLGDQYTIEPVTLQKNGTKYRGLLIGKSKNLANGRWVVQATGNGELIEFSAAHFAHKYAKENFNTLLINGPGSGLSEGHAMPYTMGEAQAVALEYLEQKHQAANLVLAGRSLGAVEMTEALKQHTLQPSLNYVVVRQVAFDSTSNVCAQVVGRIFPFLINFITSLVRWVELETDNVAMSCTLVDRNIKEVIIQNSHIRYEEPQVPASEELCHDFPIPAQATLAYTLAKRRLTANKTFYLQGKQDHMTLDSIVNTARALRSIL